MVSTSPPYAATGLSWRVFSIDVFRALTMLTMIFVNDLWTLSGVLVWLEHAPADVDFLGFSDVVFPCFLFIVGMSIPFAIRQRIDKGETPARLMKHILIRSVGLLVLGVFTVNVPDLNEPATGLSSAWYQLLMVAGFFLVWNQYPRREGPLSYLFVGLQLLGVALLVYLAIIFRGGPGDRLTVMTPQWWGILGLIGWTYLTCATLYLFFHKKNLVLVGGWLFFSLLTLASHAGWLALLWPAGPHSWLLADGAFDSFAMAGMLATLLLIRYRQSGKESQLPLVFVVAGGLFLVAGWACRHAFIISKIKATPTWVFLCCGIALLVYAGLYWLVDRKGKAGWFALIRPAGTSTLTCYLIPYVYYSVATLTGLSLPGFVTTGGAGLFKSMLFALLVVGIAAALGKLTIKLKL